MGHPWDPTRKHMGAACAFPFSRERGYFLPRKPGKFVVLKKYILPTVTNTLDRGGGGYILGYPFPEIGGSGDGE